MQIQNLKIILKKILPKYLKVLLVHCYYIFYRYAKYAHTFIRKILKILTYTYPNIYKHISLYSNDLKIHIIDKDYSVNDQFPKYTIITPVLNEEDNIIEVLKSIEEQSLKPDQVIIVDGGSSDQTVKKINLYKESSKLDILLLFSSEQNIGHQRNMAIDHSRNNLLMNVDAGTYLNKNYAANTIGPFYKYKDLDLVSGVHYPKHKYTWSVYLSPVKHFEFRVEPYGACLVYRKDIALKIGKYPEYLTYAGEDTLFCYKYKKESKTWIFNKKAFLLWEHPTTLEATKKKLFNYMIANFELGLWPYFYSSYLLKPNINLGWQSNILQNNYKKFLQKQAEIEITKRNIKGLCFILSSTSIDNLSKGKDNREKILKFIENNYKTFFINFNTVSFSNIAKNTVKRNALFLNTDHTLLELLYYKYFSIADFEARYKEFLQNSLFIIQCLDKTICKNIFALKKHFNNILVVYEYVDNNHIKSSEHNYLIQNSDWIITDQKNKYFFDKKTDPNKLIIVNSPEEKVKKLLELTRLIQNRSL
ncbi:MAG: glycosyltransferase family 2 protein [Rickettsia endosymbiont of Oxypoda opaca]|nr:glycosyltransferase family 2 protein [Rickettsia endosymbiont of Oxypoda opaca]